MYILFRKQFHKYQKVRPEEERLFLPRFLTACNEKRTRKVARDCVTQKSVIKAVR